MKTVDFLIVGQGLAGTMLAFELLDRGIGFRILCSKTKSKASLVAAGMINPLVFKRLTKSWMVDQLLPEMRARYKQLENILDDRFLFDKSILKPLSEQEAQLWKEKQKRSDFSGYIETVSENSPIDGIAEADSYGIVSGAGYLNLASFLEKAKLFFSERGLLLEGTFEQKAPFGKNIQFQSTRFEKLVFCEGYHLFHNPLFASVKMNPAKGEVLQVHAPDLSEDYILNKKVFVLPIGNKRFKVGSTYEWDDLSEKPTAEGRNSIVERLENLVKVNYTIEEHWAGVRPTIADRRPVLGAHPEFRNIFVFNGLGTKGVMLAPYFSRIMAEYLSGDESALPDEVNLSRFVLLGKQNQTSI